ncbi:MAG TPA: tol-pal system protein YbgF [Xanthobacteraceae bacterium]|jgi:tol-pal system protein YbgF
MRSAACICLTILAIGVAASPAAAQERDPNLFAQLFPRREQAPLPPGQIPGQAPGTVAEPSDLVVRIDRLEATIRQLTGMIEQLQFRNQQMEQQLRRMQEDVEFRLSGAPPGARPAARTPAGPAAAPPAAAPAPATPGRRSDVFDPTQSPNAPGAPRTLGTMPAGPNVIAGTAPDVAPATARTPGAPLDLAPGAAPIDTPRGPGPTQRLPAPGTQATLPPSDSAKDAYDLAYGYMLRRDFELATESFKKFLSDFPNDRMAPEAFYWLGESMYQRKQYRDSAESFLKISTDYPNAPRAAEALLRLGQSLAALDERETACAAFGEIGRKYPRASATVKQAVVQEQRRAKC